MYTRPSPDCRPPIPRTPRSRPCSSPHVRAASFVEALSRRSTGPAAHSNSPASRSSPALLWTPTIVLPYVDSVTTSPVRPPHVSPWPGATPIRPPQLRRRTHNSNPTRSSPDSLLPPRPEPAVSVRTYGVLPPRAARLWQVCHGHQLGLPAISCGETKRIVRARSPRCARCDVALQALAVEDASDPPTHST